MELWLIKENQKINITNIYTNLSTDGNYRSCCRTLDFGIPMSQSDTNTQIISIEIGNNIQLLENGENLFTGIVWDVSKATNGKEIDIKCKDFGIYLNKNSGFYKIRSKTPEQIVNIIAADYNLQLGEVAKTGIPISRNFFGNKLYDIIMTAYNLANDKKYYLKFDSNRLSIYEKGIKLCKPIKSSVNLLNLTYSESLESMTNRVNVYNSDNVLIDTISSDEDVKKYGILSEYLKTDENYKTKAKKMLSGVEQKITVTNFGDISYITGKAVMLEEPYTGLKGKFYIDSDTHVFKNGIYSNKLVLNFQNIMDEKEVGSYENKYTKQTTKTKTEELIFHKWLDVEEK